MLITSLENKKIKKYVSLKDAKRRKVEKLFLVEGEHLVYEAYQKGFLVDVLLLDGESMAFHVPFDITYVTSDILKKVSTLTTPSKIIGVCREIEKKNHFGKHVLILDDIQDPGNLGTIIRSSVAFSVDTIILSTNSVDIYNDKVLRSTQGMIFNMNIFYTDLEKIIPVLQKDGFKVLGTDVVSGVDVRKIKTDKYALVMGNEGHGVSDKIKSLCNQNLYIQMNDNCESLNVAVAASILLYELNRGYDE